MVMAAVDSVSMPDIIASSLPQRWKALGTSIRATSLRFLCAED